jgi:hypothetical protein
VSAIAEPLTPPNIVQLMTVTTPSPPGSQPKSTRANSTMRRPTPPCASNSPAKMNSGTASRMKGSTPPMKDRNTVSSGCPRFCHQMTPTVVVRMANNSGTPASATRKKTPKRVRASMDRAQWSLG